MTKANLTQKHLREIFYYNPETGVVTRRARPESHFTDTKETAKHTCNKWNSRHAGKVAGCAVTNGSGKNYLIACVDYHNYMLHCLIWVYMTGNERLGDIDHIDGNGINNRWVNLREVTRSGNMKNSRKSKINTSGCTGVYWSKAAEKWQAYITSENKAKYIGVFVDFFEAVCARKSAENKYGFHKNHGSSRPL